MRLPYHPFRQSFSARVHDLARIGRHAALGVTRVAAATVAAAISVPGIVAAQGTVVMPAPVVFVPDVTVRGLPAADSLVRQWRAAYTETFAYALNSGVCGRLETADDLRRRLTNAEVLQALGADDAAAESLARIAAAANADHLGLASIGRVGNALVVNGSLLLVRGGRVVARASARASTPAQLPAALRTVGRQLSQSAGWRSPADVMLTARHHVRTRARGMSEAAVMLDGAVSITDDAIRTDLVGSSADMFRMAMAALAGDSTLTAPRGGMWMLTTVGNGEVTLVSDGDRTVLPLVTDGVVAALGQMAENAGKLVEAFGTMSSELAKFMGVPDRGAFRQVVERMDVGASRIQDSVWIGVDGECPPGVAPGGGRVRCEPGRMQLRVGTGERTQADRVNGFAVEHWQVRQDVRARMEGGADVSRLLGQDPAEARRERRMDNRTLTDFWVPRGAGFCLPAISTATADPLESSLARFDQMANSQTATEFRRVMAALRAVPGGATRTVVRDWGADVSAVEPIITHQVDVTDIRQVPRDAARFVIPPGYRRLTPPQLPALMGAPAEGGAGGATTGAAGGAAAGTGSTGRAAEGGAASASGPAGGAVSDARRGAGPDGSAPTLGDKAARAAKDEVKETVEGAKAEAKAEAREKVDEAKAKAKDALTGRFKGLLKKAAKDTGGR